MTERRAMEPVFPLELERHIFELAFRDPNVSPIPLLLTAKRVQEWIEPLLYHSIALNNTYIGPFQDSSPDSSQPSQVSRESWDKGFDSADDLDPDDFDEFLPLESDALQEHSIVLDNNYTGPVREVSSGSTSGHVSQDGEYGSVDSEVDWDEYIAKQRTELINSSLSQSEKSSNKDKDPKFLRLLQAIQLRPSIFVKYTRRLSFPVALTPSDKGDYRTAVIVKACPNLVELHIGSHNVDAYGIAKMPLLRLSMHYRNDQLFNYINISVRQLPLTKTLTHLDLGKANLQHLSPSVLSKFRHLTHLTVMVESTGSWIICLPTILDLLARKEPQYARLKAIIVIYEPYTPRDNFDISSETADVRVLIMGIDIYKIEVTKRLWADGMPDIWERADEIIAKRLRDDGVPHE